ncbi:MAG: hypothetical protein ACTSXC_05250 [Candidatus Freyarchaeota archaeon]
MISRRKRSQPPSRPHRLTRTPGPHATLEAADAMLLEAVEGAIRELTEKAVDTSDEGLEALICAIKALKLIREELRKKFLH